jgi:RNA polymerase sigma-70 factor (ECF subfamily)
VWKRGPGPGAFSGECFGRARKYQDVALTMSADSEESEFLQRASRGDVRVVQDLFTRYSSRLKHMVKLRLDPRVRGRVDPSDVVQEAYLEVCRKLADYLREPKLPFFLWLRLVTGQKLALVHRQHLGVQARDAGREVSLYRGALPTASSAALAARLMGKLTTPSQAAVKAELKLRIQEALNSMDALDREVLTLRHFEQLSNAETALVLGIKETAAANRYVRALERLRGILQSMPGGLGDD